MAHVFEKKWRSEDVRVQENVDFSALLLNDRVLEGLQKAGFKKPSPIQLKAIPMGKFGKDLLVQAKSGTGKTLVFVIIALEMLKRKLFRPQTLIIVPTREIATQVCSVIKTVGSSFHKMTCNSFIGGLPLFEDQEKAVMTQIVVGTPGRLRQLIQLKSLPTNSIRLLIFDEADELLHSNSFKDDLEDIFTCLPDDKQVIATSATFNPKVKKMMYRYFGDPCIIRLNAKQLALLGMVHYAKVVQFCPMPVILYKAKLDILEKILKTVKFAQCLMFCNGIQRVEVLYKDVKRWGFSVAYISSAKEQGDRLKAMERLKRFKCKVLVSSDLTARGIDAENVDLVINFDLAYTTEIYMHRVGRAGRYGSVGVAISIIDDKELRYLARIEKEGSFKTFKLPEPTPKDLILYPPEGEFLIDEQVLGTVDVNSDPKKYKFRNAIWEAFNDDYDPEKDINTESIEENGVSEKNVDEYDACESELAVDDIIEKEEFEKEINLKNIQVKNETCNDVKDNSIKYASSELLEDVKSHDDNHKHNEECEKIDEDAILHSTNKNTEASKDTDIHFNEQMSDKKLQNGCANNDSIKQNKNMYLSLLNDYDQNELNSSKSNKLPACDIYENSDFCDKNAFEKQDVVNSIIENDTQSIKQFSNINNLETNDSEIDEGKLSEVCADNMPESSELEDIVKNLKDSSVNCEQQNVSKSCDVLNNVIKTFFDTYESNKVMGCTKLKATSDKDSQPEENSGKKLITIDMINDLKSHKHEFFYKTFKKFEEKKGESSALHKKEKENKEKSNESNSLTDLVNEEINIDHDKEKSNESNSLADINTEEINRTQEKLAKNSKVENEVIEEINMVQEKLAEVENEKIFPEEPNFESTPQPSDRIKQNTLKVTKHEAERKPPILNKLTQLFQEISDESDSDSDPNEETNEIDKGSSSTFSPSDSLSSDSESSSSPSDSENESGSETEDSSSVSESSSDYSDSSSSTASSDNEDDESVYHHNYSRTGRQNPSLVSGSVKGQVLDDRTYYDWYFQDCRCTSCGGRKIGVPRDNSYYSQVGNPPYFFDRREISSCSRNISQTRSRREQDFANHTNIQSSPPKKHSRCHRCRHSPRNETRGGSDQNFADHNNTQSSHSKEHSRCHRWRHSSRNETRGGRGQSFADHNDHQSSLPEKHSRCHRCRHSPRNETRGGRDQSFADHNNHQSSLPEKHSRCHRCRHSSRNETRGGGDQSFADHNNHQSSLPEKHSKCHRCRHSSRNETRGGGDQSRNMCPTDQRSSRHRHTLDCFLPTGHRCHPNTPDHPCRQGPVCEMWYRTFYNQWLYIQSMLN